MYLDDSIARSVQYAATCPQANNTSIMESPWHENTKTQRMQY